MKKIFFLLLLSILLVVPCFSQNMLLLGGEQTLKLPYHAPQFWTAGAGFNMKLINNYFQNDFLLNFGVIQAKEFISFDDPNAEGETIFRETGKHIGKYLFTVGDKFYFAAATQWIGLRAGVFASLGVYNAENKLSMWDFLFNGGGFAGLCFFPKSLFALAVDVNPGYAVAFRGDGNNNESGFSLSLSLSLRMNFDRL